MSELLSKIALALCCLFTGSIVLAQPKQLSEAERNYILIETLERMKGDINASPSVKEAVYKTLTRVRGTEAFIRIVQKFGLKDQDSGLLELAMKNPGKDFGVEAAQLVLEHGDMQLFSEALSRTNGDAIQVAQVLGNANDKRAVPLLLPTLNDETREVPLRKAVVHALAQTQDGAAQLLHLAKQDKLPASLKFVAGSELSSVRWAKIKTEAEKVLPPPQGKNTEPFPPLATLANMTGNKVNGEVIFFRDTAMCSRCHEVRGKGGQIGPALSEIGSKLGREALIEAILDPSAGISFGFEAFNVTLKSGDEAYGLIASETEQDLAIKDLNGIVTHYQKSQIAKRDQLKTSIMPTGLQQTMSPQEFIDLIDYLSSLKKVEEAKK